MEPRECAFHIVVEGGEHAVTVHLATDYIASARSDIIGSVRLLRVGRRLAVGVVETHADDGKLVGSHQVTYLLPN